MDKVTITMKIATDGNDNKLTLNEVWIIEVGKK